MKGRHIKFLQMMHIGKRNWMITLFSLVYLTVQGQGWERYYDHFDYFPTSGLFGFYQTSDDHFLWVNASVDDFYSNYQEQIILMKVDPSGDMVWFQKNDLNDRLAGVNICADEGIVYAVSLGNSLPGATEVYKTSANGTIEWTANHSGFFGGPIIQANDLSGYFMTSVPNVISGSLTYFINLVKLDNLGNQIWNMEFPASENEIAHRLLELPDGHIIIAGRESLFSTTELLLLKIDANGNLVWKNTYPQSVFSLTNQMLLTTDNNLLIAGNSGLTKIDTDGNFLWSTSTDYAVREIIELPDGSLVFSNYNSSNGTIELNKATSTGNILWTRTYIYPDTNMDVPKIIKKRRITLT